MNRKIAGGAVALAVLGAAAAGIATSASGSPSGTAPEPASRLDDGKQLRSQAGISEQEAIAAAQTKTSGKLGEVDLEHRDGRLVYNVDVGSHDVKVDAATGEVLAVDSDD
jgi:uncharacterized membrane protein YkoI